MNVRIVLFVLTTLLSATSIRGIDLLEGLQKAIKIANVFNPFNPNPMKFQDAMEIAEDVNNGIINVKESIGIDKLEKIKEVGESVLEQVQAISAGNISALLDKAVDGLEEMANSMTNSVAEKVPLGDKAKSIIEKAIEIRKGIAGVISKVVKGVCGSKIWTKVTIECRQLTMDDKESTCCPTCDLIWPEAVSVFLNLAEERTLRNMLLAMGRSAQITALTIGGLAGAVPFVGDVAANPANAIVAALEMVLPTNPSDELVCMREQFFMMKEQMDRMETRSIELPFHNGYMAFREKLSNLKDHFNNMQDAIRNGYCASTDDLTCEAVRVWRSHCNATDPTNDHEDPNHLFQKLHTLVTGDLFGQKFLEVASTAKNKFEHLFQVYFSITTDLHGLQILNKQCGGPETPTNDSRQRSFYANQKASQIHDFLKDFLMKEIESKVGEDKKKLDNATKESQGKNWDQLAEILSTKQNPQKGKGPKEASAELANQYPLFRTDCARYIFLNTTLERNNHDIFLRAPNFVPQPQTTSQTAINMSISYEETPRIHIIDASTVCYTFIPELTLESITNNLEFLHCKSEFMKWIKKETERSPGKMIGSNDWKPTSPFCEEWRIQKEYFQGGLARSLVG